jgi:adenosylcobinamide-GDP ribazoletransferase
MITRLARSAGMFTIVPVPARVAAELTPAEGAQAMLWLPAVGATIGAAAGLPAAAARAWAPHASLAGAVLAIAALAGLTRGLHLDGLADTADGLGSRATAGRALDIMKRPDIGPFGVAVLVLVLLADVTGLATARGGAWVPVVLLAVAAATGRVAAVHAAVRGVPAARPAGFGALVAGGVAVPAAAGWTVAVLAFGAAAALALGIPPAWVLGPQAAALAAAWLLRRHTTRRLGGVTGDVFGALIEVATAVTLIGVALR